MTQPSERILRNACTALSDVDPSLARAYQEHGLPVWRAHDLSYAMLGRLIAHQQISTTAAQSIWARVIEKYGSNMQADAILAASEKDLQACGLSRPKIAHLKSIAGALVSGELQFERVATAPLNEARAELLSVKGIGPWTAELVLLYAIGAPDAFPVGDIGLMEAHRQLGRYDTRMNIKEFSSHAEAWRPYRGVAAHLLWGWLNDRRSEAKQRSK